MDTLKNWLKTKSFGWLLLKAMTVIGFAYLFIVALIPIPQQDRLTPTEVAIFIVLLVFNSGLVEKIEELSFGELKAKFKEVKQEQEKQRTEIDTLQFLVNRFVTKEELSHLKNLENEDLETSKYWVNDEVRRELRHLRGLGFIESLPGKYIGQIPVGLKVNIREYVRLTPEGKSYLNMRQSELD